MIPVKPNEYVALALDRNYICWGRWFTARRVLQKLMNGHVKGWDADGNIVSWNGLDRDNPMTPANSINWEDRTISLWPDNPCLRSAPNPTTGLATEWPLPTVVICTRWHGKRLRAGQSISTKELHRLQKGICEYCGNFVPLSEATQDHIYPKSLGGSNEDFNIALACPKCNRDKADQYPHLNKDGRIPEGAKRRQFNIPDGITIRPEWRSHLHLDSCVADTAKLQAV